MHCEILRWPAGMEEGTRVEFVPFLPGKLEAASWHTASGARSLPLPIPFCLQQPQPIGPGDSAWMWCKDYGPLLRDRFGS
jgi:hypothetical protein